jgi:tungstate transport system ATP-binding protein
MNNGRVLVCLQEIRKSYGREVLHVEDLSLDKGLIYGVIGPSGAGKSTLLRIINLLVEPDQGRILIDGQAVPLNGKARLALQRRMTLVTQKPLLFKSTVWDNIAYGLRARGLPRPEIEERVGALLSKIGLSGQARQQAASLSGGEAQRVALARAVALEPELLLLDEPTANLDPANVELMEKLIFDLHKTSGMTIVMVTHNIFQARRVAQRVIFVYDGKIVETGQAEGLFDSPLDPRTRAFVEGSMIY